MKTLSSVREVEIARITIPDYINSSGIEISRSFNQIVDYQVSIPKKFFFLDESIPINFKITPLIKKFKLYAIESVLIQKIFYAKNDNTKVEFVRYSDVNRSRFYDDEDEGNLVYERTMMFDLSKCDNLIVHHSVETPLIKIKHELKLSFLISFPNEDGERCGMDGTVKNKICFNVGIDLLSCLVKRDVITLPKYDDIGFYCSCHPKYQGIARFVLGDSFNGIEDGRCNNITCNFADSRLPRYCK